MAKNLDSTLRLDKDNTNVALGYKQGASPILDRVAPTIPVPSNGQYPVYGKEAFLADTQDDVRAVGADPIETIWDTETYTAYVLEEHSRVARIDRQRKDNSGIMGGMVYSDPKVATKKIVEFINQRQTYLTAYLLKNMGASYYTVPGTKWDATGATPFDDMQAALRTFKKACGVMPNAILIPSHIMTYLGEAVRASYSVTAAVSNTEIFKKLAMPDLGLGETELLVDDTSANDGTDFVSVWGDNVYYLRNAKDPSDFEPTGMATLIPKGTQAIKVYVPYEIQPHKTGWFVQVEKPYLVKILDNYALYMSKSVLT